MNVRRRRAAWLGLGLTALALSCVGQDISLGEAESSAPGDAAFPEFEEPRLIEGLAADDAKDDDPALTADLLTLYFNSKREGGQGQEDIWLAERTSPRAPFAAPSPERALNTDQRETGIALAPDGLNLWFSSDRDGGAGGLDIYLATRARPGAAWSVARVAELCSAGDDLVSSLADGERTLFLARRDDDDDDYDLFVARREERTQPFAAPTPIRALNSEREESDAFLLAGSAGLVFTRDEQLMRASGYPSEDGDVVALSALNSDDDDRDAWFSGDLSYVVFSSDRSGDYRLYEAFARR